MRRFTPYRLVRPPQPISRRKPRLDNVALVPASLLPFKEIYQRVANSMPSGSILIVLPGPAKKQRTVYERVATQLKAQGQRVSTLPANRFIPA